MRVRIQVGWGRNATSPRSIARNGASLGGTPLCVLEMGGYMYIGTILRTFFIFSSNLAPLMSDRLVESEK